MNRKYDKQFKEEAVRLSNEIGVKKASEQLGYPTIHCRIGAVKSVGIKSKPSSAAATHTRIQQEKA